MGMERVPHGEEFNFESIASDFGAIASCISDHLKSSVEEWLTGEPIEITLPGIWGDSDGTLTGKRVPADTIYVSIPMFGKGHSDGPIFSMRLSELVKHELSIESPEDMVGGKRFALELKEQLQAMIAMCDMAAELAEHEE